MNALISPSYDCFSARYGCGLPMDLHNRAAGMDWAAFIRRFGAGTGPIRLGNWESAPARGGRTRYDATFGIGDAIRTSSATTFGPVAALTSMLYDAGFHIEILSFHQQTLRRAAGSDADTTATFVECEVDGRSEWSVAIAGDACDSSLRAIIGAANMLHR